jgi:hypothetical protein
VIDLVGLSATVNAPTVGVAVDGTGVGLVVEVGVGTGVSLAGVEGDFDADGFGVALAVAFAVAFGVVDCPVEPAEVPAATTADGKALAATESAGAEAATPADDVGALGSVLDAADVAGPDDAALLLCEELEHPESASAATTVTPTHPVTRTRTVMAFPPEGMRQQ